MRFDKFLYTMDMGNCEDQLQREALLELALLFVVIDGEIATEEEAVVQQWISGLTWNSEITAHEFYRNAITKCTTAIQEDDVEHFIAHRANLLLDDDVKETALTLADKIANADGVLDEAEVSAINELRKYLS